MPFPTLVLEGIPSVCGDIDEEDDLFSELAEVYVLVLIQNLCSVIVNATRGGRITELVSQTHVRQSDTGHTEHSVFLLHSNRTHLLRCQ